MKKEIRQITEGEECVVIRYRTLTPALSRIIAILEGTERRLWGRTDSGNVSIIPDELLYLESVDDRLYAYTPDVVARIEGTLQSFMADIDDGKFFRCSKSMIINVNRIMALKSLSSNRIDATMEGGEHIIISRRYAADFRRLLRGDR